MKQKKISSLEATVVAFSPLAPPLPLRLRPPSRLHPPSSSPPRLHPPSRLCPLSPSPRLQLRPPPDPPPSTSSPVPLEARSLPKPLDPPDVPDGVIYLVYVDDTSFVSKCLFPAICSVFLYWCIDWSPYWFSLSNFIFPPLGFTMLVIVFVDSTIGCSIPISISVSLPLPIQWQLNRLMPHIFTHHVNRVIYCPVSAFMKFVLLLISSSTLCGFGVGNVLLKIRDTSNIEVLIKGFVAMLKIVDCALVAASVLGFISLIVVSNF
ncbi:hypothetical protein IGI04_015143 [Brassica rapa subsp. trilocularis]|uniref:Uncharacterized protein n=1 Tax=Brassica rapa subsp. trilocularis TaxID=1813537 RepID=A0ABQ7MS98_BRACM|nr:hypothetical protein IGI04_015143 [Brassica rapa subsp. trilocularis]